MKIVDPSFEILDLSGYDQEETIGKLAYAARVCYKSFDKSSKDADKRLIKHILKREHLSVIEHKFVIIEVPLEYGKEIKMNTGLVSRDNFYGDLDFFNMSVYGDSMFISANLRTFKEYIERVGDINMLHYFNITFPYIFTEFGDRRANRKIEFILWEDLPTKEQKWVHGTITVRFIANRGFSHEIVRMRLASFSQRSTRFVDESKGINCLVPSIRFENGWWTAKHFSEIINRKTKPVDFPLQYRFEKWAFAMYSAEIMYNQLRGQDWKPQDARGVLPIDLETEIVVTARFDEWDHIFKLRTSDKAHPIMHKLIRPLLDDVKEKYPVMFKHTPRGDWNAVGA